jgi:hypothetical protein
MTIQEFEKEVQRDISPHFEFRRTQPDLCGLYYKGKFAGISVPHDFIFECVNRKYTDIFGVIHRSRTLTKHLIKFKYQFILCK